MATQGPNYPSSSVENGDSSILWAGTSSSTFADDGNYGINAFAPFSFDSVGESVDVDGFNFGATLPVLATITGIMVEIKHKCPDLDNGMQDYMVQLLKAGTPAGSDKASATQWDVADEVFTYGGDGDLWGTTWTRANIIHGNFGIRFAMWNTGGGTLGYVDYFRITIFYTTPSGAPMMTMMGVGM